MPIYKNMKNGPLTVDTAEGNALSVSGKGKFYVTRATELSIFFRRLKNNKSVRFVEDGHTDKPRPKLVIQEAKVDPPNLTPEEGSDSLPETVSNTPASDAPGQVSTADESSASVAPVDAQLPEDDFGFSDVTASGATEPQPGKGATADDDKPKSKKRDKRNKKTSG